MTSLWKRVSVAIGIPVLIITLLGASLAFANAPGGDASDTNSDTALQEPTSTPEPSATPQDDSSDDTPGDATPKSRAGCDEDGSDGGGGGEGSGGTTPSPSTTPEPESTSTSSGV